MLVAFDLLHLDGHDLMESPCASAAIPVALRLPERTGERFLYSHLATARSADEVERLDDARERRGNEGLMVKDPESVYQPGRRGARLKLKRRSQPSIVSWWAWNGAAVKRRGCSPTTRSRSALPTANRFNDAAAYTGLTDAEIATMTEHFKEITLRDFGRYRTVVPEVVVDRLRSDHRSGRHRSGFAMRFPRIVRIREDKTPADIDDMATWRSSLAHRPAGGSCWRVAPAARLERIAATGEVGEGAPGG